MKHYVIGLTGYKTAGKDTTFGMAQDILTREGNHVYRYAFADAVRQVCHLVFPKTDRDLWWDDSIKDNAELEGLHENSPRHWMRQIAQAIRALDKNFWATQVIDQINANIDRSYQSESKHAAVYHFITDLRFEEDWVPILKRVRQGNNSPSMAAGSLHPYIVWIERALSTDGHASEDFTWMGCYDSHQYMIDNRGSRDALNGEVVKLLHILQRMST